MSLITTAVKFTVLPADGVPIAGLRVRAELTRPDVDGGVLVPQPRARGDTDANGQCTIHLWPNSRGVNASQYRVKVYQGTELIHNFLITVPEQAGVVLAETIINQAPYPAVDAAQAAVTAAQAAAAEAANASRLTIGTVTEGAAAASITGEPGEQILNLVVPKGDQGIQGIKGDKGDQGLKGDQGDTGDTGPTGPAGPAGATGAKGDTGDPGPAGPSGPSGPTGPKGDPGDPGPAGPSGAGERRHAFAAPYSYNGTATAGTADSAAGWTVARITVAADGTTTVATANGAWTDRASLTYV